MMAAYSVLRINSLRPRHTRKHWLTWIAPILLLFVAPGASSQNLPSTSEVAPSPSASIDLSATGYREPSLQERLVDDTNESLDFIDDTHVLLTYDPRELFHRRPDCPPDHDDRLMRALVIEVPSGKVVKDATWYLHDRRRYLWPLGSGEFLLRRLNTLYVVDSSLQEHELLKSPRDLVWVSVTPDRKQIILETSDQPQQDSSSPGRKGNFVLQFIDRKTLVLQRTVTPRFLVKLDGTSTGYADSLHKDDLWLIRFGPSPSERRNIARVRAKDVPRVLYSSSNSLLIGRCCSAEGDYSVSSFTLSGTRLWREHWPQYRHLPVIGHSADGGRFAVSTIIAKLQTNDPDQDVNTASDDSGLEQNVQVIESATGTIIRSLWVNPVVTTEQNFSLSPDGRRVALLSRSSIDIYDLPEVSTEERARLAALNANAPELSPPPTNNPEQTAPAAAQVAQPETPQPTVAEASVPAEPVPALPVPPQPAQTASAPATNSSAPTFRAATRAVVVDVVVTDPKGNPIKGLQKDAFEITEDGREQDIRSFHEAAEPQAPPPQNPSSPSAKQSPNVFTNAAQSADPGSVMMILLDLLNTPAADQQYAREELIKFLKDRPAKSQFALAVMTGDPRAPLRMLQGFTPDENLLLDSLNRGKATPTSNRWQTAHDTGQDAARTVRELSQGDSLYKAWQALLHGIEISNEVEQSIDTEARIHTTAGTLVQLSTYLAGIPGRKSLVWLSGSFPISLPVGLNSQNPSSSTRSYARLVEQLSNLLAQSQVAVYPVYIRGMDAASDMSASISTFTPLHSSNAPTSINAFADDSPVSPYHQQVLEQMTGRLNEHMALDRIASATGGKAFYNSNAIEDAISTASEQAANYYTISYTPSNKNYDGRFRKIKVTLPDKQVRLYYRPGYFADDNASPRDIAHNIRVVAMQHGSPQSRQIHFSVRVAPLGTKTRVTAAEAGATPEPSKKSPKNSSSLIEVQPHSIDYAINASDLHFLSLANGTYQSALTFMIASFDSDGRPLTGVASASTTDTQPGDYREFFVGGFRAHQEVNVPANAASLRIGVQDQFTGYIGTVDIPLPVPKPPDLPKLVKHQLPEIEPD